MAHLYNLGEFFRYDGKEYRDAMHVAVIKVCAYASMYPGQKVRVWKNYNAWFAEPAESGEGHGIVDPFLPSPVSMNMEFLVILHPGSTNNLRHTWSHPDFEDEVSRSNNDDEEEDDGGCRGC